MLIDTHCHLDFKQFDPDRDEVLLRAQKADVKFIINVGADVNTSENSLKLSCAYDSIFAAVGIHPHYAQGATKEDIAAIGRLSLHKKVVAIGEIGLDYYNRAAPLEQIGSAKKIKQKEILCALLEIAVKSKLPVIFHCREAADDLLAFIQKNVPESMPVLMHCFSQGDDFLEFCLERDFYLSFTANITYKKATQLREQIAKVPLDKILLETDAPFLAPQLLRGKRNEPANLVFLAREIAHIKGLAVEKVAQITTENAKKFFSLKVD
ncbi:MAG: TatD family hydrolase [Candidatus Omnitrophica bacterium]|nr:TatD family hydrolase [Candidatus Omnitrophota bacterium]